MNYLYSYTGGAGEGGGFLKAHCNCCSKCWPNIWRLRISKFIGYWYSRNQSAVPYREWCDCKQIELRIYQPAPFSFITELLYLIIALVLKMILLRLWDSEHSFDLLLIHIKVLLVMWASTSITCIAYLLCNTVFYAFKKKIMKLNGFMIFCWLLNTHCSTNMDCKFYWTSAVWFYHPTKGYPHWTHGVYCLLRNIWYFQFCNSCRYQLETC